MAVHESDAVVFGRLDALGFERVQYLRNRGELSEPDDQVRKWLELRAYEKMAERDDLQRRAVEAAETTAEVAAYAAEQSRRSAAWTMLASLVALLTVVISVIDRWLAR